MLLVSFRSAETNWRDAYDTSGRPTGPTRSDTNAGNEGKRLAGAAGTAGGSMGNLPTRSGARKISTPGRSRPARSDDGMSLRTNRPALGGARRGHEEPPRCRHSAPLSIAAAHRDGHAHVQTLRSVLGSPRAAAHNKLNAT